MNNKQERGSDRSHEEIYDAIKSANTTKAQFDMFVDWFWKVTMNDIHGLKEDVDSLKKTIWKLIGIFTVVVFLLQILVPIILKVVLSNLIT